MTAVALGSGEAAGEQVERARGDEAQLHRGVADVSVAAPARVARVGAEVVRMLASRIAQRRRVGPARQLGGLLRPLRLADAPGDPQRNRDLLVPPDLFGHARVRPVVRLASDEPVELEAERRLGGARGAQARREHARIEPGVAGRLPSVDPTERQVEVAEVENRAEAVVDGGASEAERADGVSLEVPGPLVIRERERDAPAVADQPGRDVQAVAADAERRGHGRKVARVGGPRALARSFVPDPRGRNRADRLQLDQVVDGPAAEVAGRQLHLRVSGVRGTPDEEHADGAGDDGDRQREHVGSDHGRHSVSLIRPGALAPGSSRARAPISGGQIRSRTPCA